MKQIIVNVPEKKFSFFMKLMQSLGFVKVVDNPLTLEEQLTNEQMETWNNVKQGFIELKMEEEGKVKFRPIQDILNEI